MRTLRRLPNRSRWAAVRPSPRRAAVVAAALTMSAIVTIAVSSRPWGHEAQPPGPERSTTGEASPPPEEASRLYTDVRTSLVPLLTHVRSLQTTLVATSGTEPPAPGVTAQAARWADDIATARDLVGRLVAADTEGRQARGLYQIGTMLYRESANSVAGLPLIKGPGKQTQMARSGLRLYLIADRLFDQGRRLLKPDDHPPKGLPVNVPDFGKEGLDLGSTGPLTLGGSGYEAASPTSIPRREWVRRHSDRLVAAARIMNQAGKNEGKRVAAENELRSWAQDLQAISNALSGPAPEGASPRIGTAIVRLAILVESESLAKLSTASTGPDESRSQAERLRLIGDRLWDEGVGLLGKDGLPPGALEVRATGIDVRVLLAGGLFNGSPPPLRPGDPADLGVPGGLRLPDPNTVLFGG